MKATIWNDFVQMIVIGSTLVVLLIVGAVRVGSGDMLRNGRDGGRIDFNKYSDSFILTL